jgi:hypothetical protein
MTGRHDNLAEFLLCPFLRLDPLLLKVVRQGRSDRQDNCDRTSGPMPAAMRWGRAATLRAASAGLDGSEARPLMLFQQPTELGVLRPQGSLCITHTVMIADRPDGRQTSEGIPAPECERQASTVRDQFTPRLTGR